MSDSSSDREATGDESDAEWAIGWKILASGSALISFLFLRIADLNYYQNANISPGDVGRDYLGTLEAAPIAVLSIVMLGALSVGIHSLISYMADGSPTVWQRFLIAATVFWPGLFLFPVMLTQAVCQPGLGDDLMGRKTEQVHSIDSETVEVDLRWIGTHDGLHILVECVADPLGNQRVAKTTFIPSTSELVLNPFTRLDK